MANLGSSLNASPKSPPVEVKKRDWAKIGLILAAVLYLTLILFIPALNVFVQAFSKGVGPFFSNLTEPAFQNAVRLTFIIAAIAVPVNTVFGLCAAWVIARNPLSGACLLSSVFWMSLFRCRLLWQV